MTLSLSALTVVNAYREANGCYDETLGQIAQALHAVADLCTVRPHAPVPDSSLNEWNEGWCEGTMDAVARIRRIANELQNYDG